MEVPSTPPLVPLVASSPQLIKTTLVDEELVHISNDDQRRQRMIVVEDMEETWLSSSWRGTYQPHKANSGTCISWTSMMEDEGSFVWYTLRMLLHMTCILDTVSILHIIILDKYSRCIFILVILKKVRGRFNGQTI